MSEIAKPAVIPNGGHRSTFVSNWKAHEKNTLQGFLSLNLPSGMVIHNCTFHRKGKAQWIGLPSRQYVKDDGSTSYAPLIEFVTKDTWERFKAGALEAVDRFMEGAQ